LFVACGGSNSGKPEFNKAANPDSIRKLMTPASVGTRQDGIALAILLDTSGSMKDPVPGNDSRPVPKIQVAQFALMDLIRQLTVFIKENPSKKVLVGIYEFSSRKEQPSCRQVVKLGAPDVAASQTAIRSLVPEGTTPIGDAMIAAQRDLEGTGISKRHILVITDGENTVGYLPGDVASVISQEPADQRSAFYFIAFDVDAEVFDSVKKAGGLVVAASSERQLTAALDFILSGKVLVQPEGTPYPPHPMFSGRK
jgi:uncharacterized protein with von Willebrand factor type A (vWA) domain